MKQLPKARQIIEDLLFGQSLAVLATHNKAGPHASLVAFAATDDLKHLLFATSRATRKFANLTSDPRVVLLLDNRANRESDFRDAAAATVVGTAEEVASAKRECFLPIYTGKHPYLIEFVNSPACALLKVQVQKYCIATRFQKVTEYRITS